MYYVIPLLKRQLDSHSRLPANVAWAGMTLVLLAFIKSSI